MREIKFSAGELSDAILNLAETEMVFLLDSCGVSHLGSHLLLAGVRPIETHEFTDEDPEKTLEELDRRLNFAQMFGFFTISYDFGLKLHRVRARKKEFAAFAEPDVFLVLFDCIIVHDYQTTRTFLAGRESRFDEIENALGSARSARLRPAGSAIPAVRSNFSRAEYLEAIENIKEYIRRGDTYQTNLTQQIRAELPANLSPQQIFRHLRRHHPAPFSSFIRRRDSFVVSASPERFFKVESENAEAESAAATRSDRAEASAAGHVITTSPIKGTRPRGRNGTEDEALRRELLDSQKDHAENVMIVDLLRNDIGRICEYGSVRVEKLCDLEEHPTLFHLVSTVSGRLREPTRFSDIIRAVFPCGSITGAPKIRTMQIIDEIETANRGLAMGAIGCSLPASGLHLPDRSGRPTVQLPLYDLAVAIRTMVIRGREAVFNVGGGIVIDSVPEKEYEESLIKGRALLNAINAGEEPAAGTFS